MMVMMGAMVVVLLLGVLLVMVVMMVTVVGDEDGPAALTSGLRRWRAGIAMLRCRTAVSRGCRRLLFFGLLLPVGVLLWQRRW
jgi:hypothetical protein